MKRRVRKIANFFAFNLLFFALYLNFIHKDKAAVATIDQGVQQNTAAFSGTVLVDNPAKYLETKNVTTPAVNIQPVEKTDKADAGLKLSIN